MARKTRIEVPCDDGVVEAVVDTYKGGWVVSFPFGDRRFFGTEREVRSFIKKELVAAG
jgi:hypothetical protein